MSDAKLRELERRWRETRSVEDEAAYLHEQVRAGVLSPERLELAALCGHAACLSVIQSSEPAFQGPLSDWTRRIERFGKAPCVACAVLAASCVLGQFSRWRPSDRRPIEAVGRARLWLSEDPSRPETEESCRLASKSSEDAARDCVAPRIGQNWDHSSRDWVWSGCAQQAAMAAARTAWAAGRGESVVGWALGQAVSHALQAADQETGRIEQLTRAGLICWSLTGALPGGAWPDLPIGYDRRS